MGWFKKPGTLIHYFKAQPDEPAEEIREPVIAIANLIRSGDASFRIDSDRHLDVYTAYQVRHNKLYIYTRKIKGEIDGFSKPDFGINKAELSLIFNAVQDSIDKGREQQKDIERARLTKIFCE